MKGDFKNKFNEIHHHVEDDRDRDTILSIKGNELDSKDKVRACDLRAAMIMLASEICKTSDNEDLKDLLLTSVEMARIFYLPLSDRNERLILRMYNTTYRNLQALKKIVKNPISMTLQGLLGQYIHALGVHAADLLRYTPLSSSIAEEEEK